MRCSRGCRSRAPAILCRIVGGFSVAVVAASPLSCTSGLKPGDSPHEGSARSASFHQALPPTRTFSFSLKAPPGSSPDKSLMAASEWIRLADRNVVGGSGDSLLVGGGGGLQLGVNSSAPIIRSSGPVFLQNYAKAVSIASAGAVTLQQGATAGSVTANNPSLLPAVTYQFTADVPGSYTDVLLAPGQAKDLAPGAYRTVSVKQNSVLLLTSGTYYMDALGVEAGGIIRIRPNGPFGVRVAVVSNLWMRGTIDDAGDPRFLFVAYLGQNDVPLETAFRGTVLAPNATVNFGARVTHIGAFYAARIQTNPDAKFVFVKCQPDTVYTDDGASPPPRTNQPLSGPPPALGGTGSAAAASTHEFLLWLSRSTIDQADAAIAAVHSARGNVDVSNAMVAEVQSATTGDDISRSLVTMSALGELASPEGEQFFQQFLQQPIPTTGALMDPSDGMPGVAIQMIRLQTKAIHGLAHRMSGTSDQAILQLAANNPVASLRHEAIRAYLEHYGPTGRATLLGVVKPEDVQVLDRVERFSSWDQRSFPERLNEHIAAHASEYPSD